MNNLDLLSDAQKLALHEERKKQEKILEEARLQQVFESEKQKLINSYKQKPTILDKILGKKTKIDSLNKSIDNIKEDKQKEDFENSIKIIIEGQNKKLDEQKIINANVETFINSVTKYFEELSKSLNTKFAETDAIILEIKNNSENVKSPDNKNELKKLRDLIDDINLKTSNIDVDNVNTKDKIKKIEQRLKDMNIPVVKKEEIKIDVSPQEQIKQEEPKKVSSVEEERLNREMEKLRFNMSKKDRLPSASIEEDVPIEVGATNSRFAQELKKLQEL